MLCVREHARLLLLRLMIFLFHRRSAMLVNHDVVLSMQLSSGFPGRHSTARPISSALSRGLAHLIQFFTGLVILRAYYVRTK